MPRYKTPRPLAPSTRYRATARPDGSRLGVHRKAVEDAIGRRLAPDEIVHHANEVKTDNRLENLEVTDPVSHGLHHHPPILPVVKTCEACGTEYRPHKTKRRRQKSCSWTCRNELIRRAAYARGSQNRRAS